ncbi:MAG: zinc-binding dehydrogenase [Thaumarchaeota archaeon]|nr:zinc-binding dehydrogenase [Nitrososphaerota archaeon]
MKALVYEEYAPDDNYKRILKLKELPEPKPKPNEVVFKVKVAGLNYDDIWGMRGKPIQIPMPHISGTDAAGEVIAVGEDVTNILGSTQGTKAESEESMYWMSKGKIKSIIDSVYTFENAADAHTKMLKGNIFGKILMKPE